HPGWSRFNQTSQFRLQFCHLALHLPRYTSVAEMPFDSAAEPGDVLGLGEIHLEQETGAPAERKQVVRSRSRQTAHRPPCRFHGLAINLSGAGRLHQLRCVISQFGGIGLSELLASSMTMQIAVCTNVDYHIVGVESRSETRQQVVSPGARLERH